MFYEKLISFVGKYFLYTFLFGIPFLVFFFGDIMGKKLTFNFWLASFIPQLLTFLCLCYNYNLLKRFKKYSANILVINKKAIVFVLLFAILLPLSIISINYFFIKSIDINFQINHDYLKKLPIIFILIFFSALIEELVFRFIPYELIPKKIDYKSLFIVNTIFLVAHVFNPNFNILGLISVLFAGVLLTIIYIKTNNILYSTLIHTFWNFIIGPILGGSVSGINTGGLLSYNLLKSEILTGGNYGLEGSIITVIVLTVAIVSIKHLNISPIKNTISCKCAGRQFE